MTRQSHQLDQGLTALRKLYRSSAIVLYVGAGISTSNDLRKFGVPLWRDLLSEIADKRANKPLPEDPWLAADVAQNHDSERFLSRLKRRIQKPEWYTRQHRQLKAGMLEYAPSLAAVTAFCGKLQSVAPTNPRAPSNRSYMVFPNPRVRAVISTNYDCLLESASSTLFRKPILKPVAAFGSSAGPIRTIPVYHIHGYLPQSRRENSKADSNRQPLIKQIVLTRKAYERAWRYDDVFASTMTTQVHHLRHYPVLFLGFSFSDKKVVNLLKEIASEESKAKTEIRRFAIMKRPLSAELLEKLDECRVSAIAVDDFEEVTDKLGQLYTAGLEADWKGTEMSLPVASKGRLAAKHKLLEVTIKDVWPLLLSCRNGNARLKRS